MSRLYFHSEHGEAELKGSERIHLGLLGDEFAVATLDAAHPDAAHRMAGLMHPDYWLARNLLGADSARALGELKKQLVLPPMRPVLSWRDRPIRTDTVLRNTAIRLGNDQIKLAVRLNAQCEIHAWVDGPNRAWLADIMQAGLDEGPYRAGLAYAGSDGSETWRSQGWEDVIALLRSRDDGPVVTSSSFCDSFPNQGVAAWEPPPMPEDWAPDDLVFNPQLRADWISDHSEEEREEYCQDENGEWEALTDEEQWRLGMEGLRADADSWLELTPERWSDFYFREGITLQDLIAGDRDERLGRAFARCDADEDEGTA